MMLSQQDSVAVDLLLDGTRVENSTLKTFVQPEVGAPERLGAAQKVLSLLDNLEVEGPSADLIQRTLRRIESSNKSDISIPIQLDAIGGQPVA